MGDSRANGFESVDYTLRIRVRLQNAGIGDTK
jgi:hypothetical protein